MEEIIKILEEIKNEELDPKGKETVHVNNSITSKFRRLNNELEKIKGYESIEKVKKQILDLNNENSLINVLSKQKGTLKQKHAESLISQIETLISKCKEDIEKNNTKVEGIYNDYSLNGGEVKMDLNEQIENLRKEALELLDSIEVISKEQKEEYRKTILDAKDIDNLNICMTTLKGIAEADKKVENKVVEEENNLTETEETKEVEDVKINTDVDKKDISFDYYGKTEVENIQKELMNNITDLKYSFIEQQKKTEQKKEKLEEVFKSLPPLDPEWAKTNKMLEDERFRLNRINNLLNSDNFKELLNIENAINSIKIEHNKETKRYHVVSNVNPYELAQKTSNVLIKLQDDINTQDLGDSTFTNSVKEKMQTINNNMKRLYAKFGYTDLYFDIKTKYDKINYLKNQINHWKELEKIQGKSYEKEINEALYEIEVIKNTIKSLIDNLPEEEKDKITNIDEIKDIIEDIEDKKEKPEEVTETPEEEPKEDIYNDRDAIIETIKGIVSTISLDEPEEKLNKKLDEIEKYLIKLNKLDQKEFEEKYNNAKTDEEKQQLIADRENQVESYRELLKHEDKEVEKLLSDRFNPLIDGFKNDIVKDKEKTDDKPIEKPEEQKEEIPKKGRLKVMAKKALKWMKEHKLATIAIGLALTTAIMFAIPSTHMMINSALWNVGSKLGWSAGTLGKLHSINLGLSKSVAGGAYIFESMSGAYTLGGAAGASALYGSGAANLVGALTGLTGLGAIGTFGASIINKIKNRKKKKEDEPKEVSEEEIKEEKEEIVEETKSKEKELEKENEKSTTVENDKEETKSTPLTKEQIAEMIKAEVEKAVAQKNAEISKLSAENEMLKAEIEMLKKQGLQPEEIEEENIMKL